MTLSGIQKLVLQDESETLELKKSTAQLHAAYETICAFLKGKGGTEVAARTIGDGLAFLKYHKFLDSEGSGRGAKCFNVR